MHYSPVRRSTPRSKLLSFPLDLHVLGLPPAFNLSQDQTLQFKLQNCRTGVRSKRTRAIQAFVYKDVSLWILFSGHWLSPHPTEHPHKSLVILLKSVRCNRSAATRRAYYRDETQTVNKFFVFYE